MSSSIILLCAFFIFTGSSILGMWLGAAAASAVFTVYLLQVHYLGTIGRHGARRRLRTWKLSLAAHSLVFAVCYLVVRDSVVFVFLLPEAVSALIHLLGIRCAQKAKVDV